MFNMKKILLICFMLMAALIIDSQAQERRISGRVVDQDGLALPGVNVILKGSTTGTTSDIDGNYILTVAEPDGVLVFSFIGFATQEVEIGSQSIINVTLASDTKQLSEVVVTGYGETTKSKLISSIAVVNSERIENVPMPDVSQILQGQAPGVQVNFGSGQPGSQGQVRIRGTGSLNADGRGPLYVIDGVIIENGNFTTNTETNDILASINPNDIESLNVLKDASATALYGARAANGVILINTKSGRAGKTQLTFKASYGITERNDGNFELMNSAENLQYERELLAAVGTTQEDIDAIRPLSLAEVDTDWVDEAFQTGSTQNYEVSASGGNERTTFFLSGGYFQQDGILIESEFQRYSARINIDHQATDKIDFGLRFNVSYTQGLNATAGNRFSSPLLGAFVNSPFDRVRDPDTGELFVGNEPDRITFTGDNFVRSVPLNPVTNNNLRTLGNFNIGYDILENLRISTKVGIDFVSINEKDYFDPTTPDGLDTDGSSTSAYNENIVYTSQTILSGNKSVNNVHNFDGIVAFEFQKAARESFEATGIGFASGKLKTLDSSAEPQNVGGFNTEYSFVSYLGQLNYNYKNRYFLTTSFRRDGSSRFGEENKYANFWSVGASWRLIEESFIEGLNLFSDLKLRGSYGTSGNAEIDNFASRGLYGYDAAYNGIPGGIPSQLANPELTWETSKSLNIGLDFGFLNNRINGTIEYYKRNSTDLLLEVPISATSGLTEFNRNVGEIQNSGFEVTLSTQNFVGEFNWTTDINFTMNDNKVIELNEDQDIPNGNQIIREGEPVRSWFMRQWAGVNPADGTPRWSDGEGGVTGNLNEAPELIVGNAEPDWISGITNTFSYKGISLSAFIYLMQGHEIFNSSRRFIESDGQRFGWSHLVEAADRWRQPGDISERPEARVGGNNQANSISTRFLEDGSFIRLRNVTLAYNLPSNLINRMKLGRVRVYATGQNMLTITDYSGFDPELAENGEEFFRYPNGRTIILGIEVGF